MYHIIFVDRKAAYDSVLCDEIFTSMARFGNFFLILLVGGTMSNVQCRVGVTK